MANTRGTAVLPERTAPSAPASAPKAARAAKKSTQRARPTEKHVDDRGRVTRAQEESNSELFERVPEDKEWERPSSLAAPPDRPGFRQRWVRVGYPPDKIDEKNLSSKLREGWRARHISTIPAKYNVPRVKHGRFAGAVVVEGMLLCEIPERILLQRSKAMRKKIDDLTEALDANLREANAGSRAGGFGPIKRAQTSKVVREVNPNAQKEADEVDLGT